MRFGYVIPDIEEKIFDKLRCLSKEERGKLEDDLRKILKEKLLILDKKKRVRKRSEFSSLLDKEG